MSDAIREAFEDHVRSSRFATGGRIGDNYANPLTQRDWELWQAAFNALQSQTAPDAGKVVQGEPVAWMRSTPETMWGRNLFSSTAQKGWTPLYTHPAESREEIQAQALETYADQLDAVFERAQEARAVNCPAWHSGQFAKDARKQAARLRASQKEGDE